MSERKLSRRGLFGLLRKPEAEPGGQSEEELPPWAAREKAKQRVPDLSRVAHVLAFRLRRAADSHADDPQISLAQALMLLALSSTRAVQVRYFCQRAFWIDTLVPQRDVIRLIRMQAPALGVPAAPEHPAPPPETSRHRLPIVS